MHPPLLTLQHSSFLVTPHFTLFNFLLFFLTLFLLCNLPPLIHHLHHLPPLNPSSCLVIQHHSPPCILPLLHPPSPTHHPLQLYSLLPNHLPPLQPSSSYSTSASASSSEPFFLSGHPSPYSSFYSPYSP